MLVELEAIGGKSPVVQSVLAVPSEAAGLRPEIRPCSAANQPTGLEDEG
jgi:hypothetical protein